jgi:hypothetical protein
MAFHTNEFDQVEGQWEELIQHANQFAGRRVRVTVLADERSPTNSLQAALHRWLAEGEELDVASAGATKTDPFGEGLAEKFRKQGLVL